MPICRCNDVDIYYEVAGEGEPILFINGLSSDLTRKEAFLDELKKHFKLIAFDMRGVGRSGNPKEPFTIEDNADDAYELINHVGLEKTNVVGFSMGGSVAINLALKYPKAVNKLILMSTIPAWGRPYDFSKRGRESFSERNISEKFFEEMFYLLHGSKHVKTASVEDYVKLSANPKYPQSADAYAKQLKACEGFDLMDRVSEIKHETLIVTGDEDGLIDPRNSLWMHEHLANSKIIVYKGVGHMVPDEVTEKVVEDVGSFLIKKDRF